MQFSLENLQIPQKAVPLQRVFHSIRFKVNKGWSTAVLLFFALYQDTLMHINKIHSHSALFGEAHRQ